MHLCVTGALRPQTDTALGQVCTESVRVLFLVVVSVAMGTTWTQREEGGDNVLPLYGDLTPAISRLPGESHKER